MSSSQTQFINPLFLYVMRAIGFGVIVASLWLIAINIPLFYQFVVNGVQNSPTLLNLGITPDGLAIVRSLIRRFGELCFIGLAITLVIRSMDIVPIIVGMVWALLGANLSGAYIEVVTARPDLQMPVILLALLTSVLAALVLFILPDGQFYPRWSPALLFVYLGCEVARIYIQSQGINHLALFFPFTVVWVIGFIAQYQRYRRGNSIYQHQMKWVLFGAVVAILALLIGQIAYVIVPSDWFVITAGIDEIGGIVLAISLIVAITRYRLYDINAYIHRVLVYALVGILTLGGFVVLWLIVHSALRLVFSAPQTFSWVLPSILIGLLFNPLRHAVIRWVDRELYGFRFDFNQLLQGSREIQIANPGLYTGYVVGGFTLGGVIGRGGMGEVYLGEIGERKAAIKLLPPEKTLSDNDLASRLLQEGHLVQSLDHPNIVRCYGYGVESGIAYVALEYVRGETLQKLLRTRGRLSLEDALNILEQICAGLMVLHERGIVHRDIKPSNILLRLKPDGEHYQVILTDFGIAFNTRQTTATTITGVGAIGTIDYMSPEQIQESGLIDARADIYALGVVLYEMLTGELPFAGGIAKVLFAHVYQPPPNPRDRVPDLSEAAVYTVMRCLAKNPQDRFARVEDVGIALANR
ncbi:MAG: serine/threonine protein kinase [Anaerolineae bacterium]|jgi:tRNA A-37 threonylcarbamoyl transferase component Bud32|nr:serine/threonine protein kinase [Anaerolineae bacterium]